MMMYYHRGSKPTKSLINNIKTRLTDISAQTINDHLNKNKTKLIFLSKLKEEYKREKYLKIENVENRRAITKLRTSAHNLLIETGRWENIDRKSRICRHCYKQEIEDEEHFLFYCNMYAQTRPTTFQSIKELTTIDLLNTNDKIHHLKELFNSDNLNAINSLGKFIKNSFKERQT